MKTSNKYSRSAQFCSLIIHIKISRITAVFGITHMRWLNHQSELSGDTRTLHYRVGWFRIMLRVKFRHHQTSYLSLEVSFENISNIWVHCKNSGSNSKKKSCLTFRHRASCIQDRRFTTLQRTLFIYLINKNISLSEICQTVHH